MLTDIDVAPVAESIRSEWEIPRSDLEPPSDDEDFVQAPSISEIILSTIDNIDSVQPDPRLSYEPIASVPHNPSLVVLPMGLSHGNTDYQAALRTIVNCEELLNMFKNNLTILLAPTQRLPEMSSYHYKVLIRQRKLLAQVMHSLCVTLREDQMEISHDIQCMIEDD
jgi:hypothetical protein